MRIKDTQFTADELALMRGEELPASADDTPADDDTPAAEAADDDHEGTQGDGTSPSDDATPAEAADPAEQTEGEAGFVPQFDGTLPEGHDERLAALDTKEAQIDAEWAAGNLSDDERREQLTSVRQEIRDLLVERAKAEALAEANAQIQKQQADAVLKEIMANGAKNGIDYQDAAVAGVFDAKVNEVRADPAFQNKPFAILAAEAHARVAKLFGKAITQPSGTKADGTKPNERERVPQTLGNLPAAAAANLIADPIEDDLGDDPDVAEARWAQMPASKRNTVLRATLPASRRR